MRMVFEEKIDLENYRTSLEPMCSEMRLLTVTLFVKLFMFFRRKPRLVSRSLQALTIVVGFQGRCSHLSQTGLTLLGQHGFDTAGSVVKAVFRTRFPGHAPVFSGLSAY